MRKTEILAPAGTIESLYGAFKMGADAVYTGTSRFGARAFAENPAVPELEKALTYAHLRGKKIYLTVNTLLNTRELEEELYPLIRPLYEAGLDACIVQDMGVMAYLHEYFPDMDLHASTQMTLFSGEEANLFRKYGVTRYVPARELTIEEIRSARQETDMEIEVFVHGALCYCYSGQCLMSEVIGGRSGNRGMCAQPCRLYYRTAFGGGHVLNTKDTCTLTKIPELVDAGIDSFKIEGRMKKMEYSAGTAYLYRKYVDLYLEKGKEWYTHQVKDKNSMLWKDYEALSDLYNRGGFSDSFLFEKDKKKMVYLNKNGHFGTRAGKVLDVEKNRVRFLAQTDLHYQDVLEFREDKDHQTYEYTVKDPAERGDVVTANIKKGSRILPGDGVYRRKNQNLLEKIRTRLEKTEDKIALKGKFYASFDEPVTLTIEGNGVLVTVSSGVCTPAANRPVSEADVRKSIDSLGNTDYTFASLEIELPDHAFLPVGGLKKLRREAICRWEQEAVLHREAPDVVPEDGGFLTLSADDRRLEGNYVEVSSAGQIRCVLDCAKGKVVYVWKLADFSPEDWGQAAALLEGQMAVLAFPHVLRGKKLQMFEKNLCGHKDIFDRLKPAAILVNSHRSYLLAKKYFPDCILLADENLYRMNTRAEEVYRGFGLLPAPDRNYGRIPVMTTEGCVAASTGHCPNTGKKKKDRIWIEGPKGDRFAVVTHCDYCYNTIYTEDPVVRKRTEEPVRVDLTWEDEAEVRKVLSEWNI